MTEGHLFVYVAALWLGAGRFIGRYLLSLTGEWSCPVTKSVSSVRTVTMLLYASVGYSGKDN